MLVKCHPQNSGFPSQNSHTHIYRPPPMLLNTCELQPFYNEHKPIHCGFSIPTDTLQLLQQNSVTVALLTSCFRRSRGVPGHCQMNDFNVQHGEKVPPAECHCGGIRPWSVCDDRCPHFHPIHAILKVCPGSCNANPPCRPPVLCDLAVQGLTLHHTCS